MKKKFLLLVVIYLAFISLGLPDSLLGAAWPAMYKDLAVPIKFAGIISLIVAGGTVVSSLSSARVIAYFGVAKVTAISVLMTALALLGFSYSHHFIFLCLLAVPLGLGAGSVDAGLNNYVAVHYRASHMNWLHCFWGIGAAVGPLIMSRYLEMGESWTKGYNTIGWIQLLLVVILFFSFPLWVKRKQKHETDEKRQAPLSLKKYLAVPGLKQALLVFFCYCTIEATFGLWGASYLVFNRGFQADDAARMISFYYLGITLGRFLSGFGSFRLHNRQMVYIGETVILLALFVLALPLKFTLLPGFLLVGLGCAPIFPSLLHETPVNFGEEYSQAIMGIQMASAYIGIALMPLFFGQIAALLGYSSLLWFIGIFLAIIILMTYRLNVKVDKAKAVSEY